MIDPVKTLSVVYGRVRSMRHHNLVNSMWVCYPFTRAPSVDTYMFLTCTIIKATKEFSHAFLALFSFCFIGIEYSSLNYSLCDCFLLNQDKQEEGDVRMGLPVGVGIGSLPVTPNRNGEIGVWCVESDLAGVPQHNKT